MWSVIVKKTPFFRHCFKLDELSYKWPSAEVFKSIYFLDYCRIMLLSVCVKVKFQLTRARVYKSCRHLAMIKKNYGTCARL